MKPPWLTCVPVLVCWPLFSLAQITETKIIPSDGAPNDYFGLSVSVSGEHSIIGANWDDDQGGRSGSAYIFRHDNVGWTEESKITASDGEPFDFFGAAVSVSGDYAIVGSPLDDDNGLSTGSAYIFSREGIEWVQKDKLLASDGGTFFAFGSSVSIDGDYAIVGAPGANLESGAAYIFRREDTDWVEEAKLLASDVSADDGFGYSVAISGNSAIVSAPWNTFNGYGSGSAYVFTRQDPNWIEEVQLIPCDGTSYQYFGGSVSISGDYVTVGAPGGRSAYVFTREGLDWVEDAKLIPSDVFADGVFGHSVSISLNRIIIGDYADDDAGNASGSAYVFSREGLEWIQVVKLVASDGSDHDEFGRSVAISGENSIVGAYRDDDNGMQSGSAYAYSGLSATNCNDYTSLVTRCFSGGTVQARLILLNNIAHSGETVLFQIDSTTYPAIIADNGVSSRASISISGVGSGSHTVSVLDPAGCFEPTVVTCASGLERADQEWDADDERWTAEVGDAKSAVTPTTTKLLGNYPNPFNPSTSINYVLSEDGFVSLKIFNTLGEEVATLVNEYQVAGIKSAVWEGRNNVGSQVASGIYVYRLTAGDVVESEKMLFMK